MSEAEVVLASAGSERNLLVFKLTEFEGNRLLDVRKYFLDKKSGELCPTRKGIALGESGFSVLKQVIEEKQADITDWFIEDAVVRGVASNVTRMNQAGDALSKIEHSVHVLFEDWKSPAFFRAEFEGPLTLLFLNTRHPFARRLADLVAEDNPSSHIVISMLEGFARAKHLYDGESSGVAEVLLDGLLVNWGLIMTNPAKSKQDACSS
ncbi:MAG: hypothetical protein GX934_11565 [Burkholderiales bacterium]|nr:hypothetical protein [Burkholderiales bacterium]